MYLENKGQSNWYLLDLLLLIYCLFIVHDTLCYDCFRKTLAIVILYFWEQREPSWYLFHIVLLIYCAQNYCYAGFGKKLDLWLGHQISLPVQYFGTERALKLMFVCIFYCLLIAFLLFINILIYYFLRKTFNFKNCTLNYGYNLVFWEQTDICRIFYC